MGSFLFPSDHPYHSVPSLPHNTHHHHHHPRYQQIIIFSPPYRQCKYPSSPALPPAPPPPPYPLYLLLPHLLVIRACLPSVHVPPEQSAPTKLDNIARRTTMKTRTEAEQPTTPLPYQASHFSVQPASQPAGSSVLYIEFASHRATVESLVVVVIGRVIIINIVGPRAGWRHSEQQQQQYHQATTTNDDQPCINSYRSSHCLCWRWLACLLAWLAG